MNKMNVQIVQLPPMRVASVHGFGSSPEIQAWNKLATWTKARGVEQTRYRIFGFNNPDPSPGSPNYGYEFWVTVGEDVAGDDVAEIKQVAGGLYAVLRCEVKGDFEKIGQDWRQLVAWRENSRYHMGQHQWLEEHLGGIDVTVANVVLELMMPVAE